MVHAVAPTTAMNLGSQQRVHPFFTKAQRLDPHEHQSDVETSTTERAPGDENQPHSENANEKHNSRGYPSGSVGSTSKRKSGEALPSEKVKQTSLSLFTKTNGSAALETRNTEARDATSGLEPDVNHDRRKRQKRESPAVVIPVRQGTGNRVEKKQEPDQESWIQQLQEEAAKTQLENETSASVTGNVPQSPRDGTGIPPASVHEHSVNDVVPTPPAPPSSPPDVPISPEDKNDSPRRSTRKRTNNDGDPSSVDQKSPPKKMLRLNARGRFSSPVSTVPKPESVVEDKQKRTQKKTGKPPKQFIAKMAYTIGEESSLALDIDNILAGTLRAPTPKSSKAPEPLKPKKATGPPKPTHPFFARKSTKKSKDEAMLEPPKPDPTLTSIPHRRESTITPGKLRAQAATSHDDNQTSNHCTKPAVKRVGIEAPWPWKGIVRVDGGDAQIPNLESQPNTAICGRRKLKNNIFRVPPEQDLIFNLTQQMKPHLSEDLDGFSHCKYGARFPTRMLTTGPEIQFRVRKQLQTMVSFDENGNPSESAHPPLKSLFDRIAVTLTPFDKGICESVSWVQKYAPKTSAEFLGSSMEVAALRQWLESLKISAVEGGSNGLKGGAKKGAASKPTKKKRKKHDEMDDFVVSDDELGELGTADSEEAGQLALPAGQRSMIRKGGDWVGGCLKTQNLILISGPHGVGKTAAIYAVANELDFQVFEINSSSRRSGKDVLDRIGDMTANHIVQRKSIEANDVDTDLSGVDRDSERLADALEKDIQSGKQKSMSAFFKPACQTQSKAKPQSKVTTKPNLEKSSSQSTLGGKPKHTQKQSVILLEEVDVLFADDKSFWQTVEHLAISSKRPIIMTCTDESLVPIPDASLHAKLRFAPAPQPVMSDYLLLLAAAEGHVLQHEAISKLCENKNYDLRSTIMELDFWCQMAVGDRKGGLEWIHPRWPPGQDVNEHGQTLRVASQGTYQAGMGWLSHDVLYEDSHVGFDRQHELLLELTDFWGFEPRSYKPASSSSLLGVSDSMTLQDMERLTEMSSATDVYCRVDTPVGTKTAIDPTQPPLSEKARSNHLEPHRVLQADPFVDYSHLDTHMVIASHLAVQRSSSVHQTSSTTFLDPTDLILSHLDHSRKWKPTARPSFFVFDPLAEPPANTVSSTSPGLVASSFDRNFAIITTDLAPYVRSIAAYDLRLENERIQKSNLLSAGGKPKRSRTTRAARSAQEGGRREQTRRERWFKDSLNLRECLEKTAGESWAGLGSRARPVTADGEEIDVTMGGGTETASPASTAESAE
ncbi:hypothetical protein IWX90DRAFT_471818 [Phyllosticta citrichinensis]|uniref:AAA+ ATPase domain-containing protein n=1 Tax=Phyllosticta citrichinensis TaxID=1130410 RepID=A0ABR1XQL9_9PEZI